MNRDLAPAAVIAVTAHAAVLVAMPSPLQSVEMTVSDDDGLRVVMLASTAAPQREASPETSIDLPELRPAPLGMPETSMVAPVSMSAVKVTDTAVPEVFVASKTREADAPEAEMGTVPFSEVLPVAVPVALPEMGTVPISERDPVAVENDKPRYPKRARERGWEGSVVLRVEVLATGTCNGVEIKKSSGHGILDRAAVRAVKAWRFEPATRDGTPIRKWIEVPVEFRLED